MQAKIQAALDKWVGPGNSTATVTADLDFDKAVVKSRKYTNDKKNPPLSETTTTEKYNGPAGSGTNGAGGVVGPDGQMDPSAAAGNGRLGVREHQHHPRQHPRRGRGDPGDRARLDQAAHGGRGPRRDGRREDPAAGHQGPDQQRGRHRADPRGHDRGLGAALRPQRGGRQRQGGSPRPRPPRQRTARTRCCATSASAAA
nr:flagellar M-ring protein FliF C-terminal domain-containing protein [Nocardioides convexus]